MAFLLNCNNRGCGKPNIRVELDQETQQVICPECENEILNVSSFTKNQLKLLKQFRKPKRDAFGVSCKNQECKHFALPILIDNKLACPKCQKLHTGIPKTYEMLVREKIKEKSKENQDV